MYGLLLDSIQKFIREKYGEQYWQIIRSKAKLSNHWFMTHEVYKDSVMSDLVDAAADTLGESRQVVMEMFGHHFVQTIGRYGYARLLRVLGRDLRDFLNGLDDLHEYLRFSYPKIRPPSFFCEKESPNGMVLHYITRRKGYLSYVIGQLKSVGTIYKKELTISMLSENSSEDESHFVLELSFDNREMLNHTKSDLVRNELHIDGPTFLTIFPFCVVFNDDMIIETIGTKLQEVLPDLIGQSLDEAFIRRRPLYAQLKWDSINRHTNCTFELVSREPVCCMPEQINNSDRPLLPTLRLKGQMLPLSSNSSIVFLCSPVVDSPEELYQSNLFVTDLALHDCSKEYILAGSQQNPELSLALSQEQIRCKQLEESIQQTDDLLYQMIPKQIADKLRNGEPSLNTCQELPCVSILFADIVSFTPMCTRLRPMEVVSLLNTLFVSFDRLCERHHVYKVQTIGDGYMAVSGMNIETVLHADYMTDFGLSAIEVTSKIIDPSIKQPLSIRVGIHSGRVVAGVVGSTILRYDVYGDSVNIAARMEATGEPMKIHISKATADLLEESGNFNLEERGEVKIKGKGMMKTYWVVGKNADRTNVDLFNPLQLQQRNKARNSERSSVSPSLSSNRRPNHKSNSPQPQRAPGPTDWPELERARRMSSHSYVQLPSVRSSIDLGISFGVPALPHHTQIHRAEMQADLSLKGFAKLAKENVKRAQTVADWATYLAAEVEENMTKEEDPEEHHHEETSVDKEDYSSCSIS